MKRTSSYDDCPRSPPSLRSSNSSCASSSADEDEFNVPREQMRRWWTGVGVAENDRMPQRQERHALVEMEGSLYAAVLDGTSKSAEVATSALHKHFLEDPELLGAPSLLRAFKTDHGSDASVPDGTNALAALVTNGSLLTVCNVGSSRAVLGCSGRKAVHLASAFDGRVRDERDERIIVGNGGGMAAFRGAWQLASHEHRDSLLFKKTHNAGFHDAAFEGPSPLSCKREPHVVHRSLSSSEHFLILASDGLWEALSNEEAVACVYDVLGDEAISSGRLSEGLVDIAAAALIARATSHRSSSHVDEEKEPITVLIVLFQWRIPPPLRTAPKNSFRSSRRQPNQQEIQRRRKIPPPLPFIIGQTKSLLV